MSAKDAMNHKYISGLRNYLLEEIGVISSDGKTNEEKSIDQKKKEVAQKSLRSLQKFSKTGLQKEQS